MLMPCEVAVKCVLPVIRSALTKELTHEYGLTQTETANLLGITQPAVSHYLRKVRGNALDLEQDEELSCHIREIAAMLYGKDASSREMKLKVCSFCETIRGKGFMCEPHRRLEPELTKECGACLK
jgi:predicted transcriptional regulator